MFDKRMFARLSVGITSFLQLGLCLNSFRHLGERTKSFPEPSVSKRSAFKKKKIHMLRRHILGWPSLLPYRV